ncbi:MAG: Lrp/AsnC family transcriptional regulator, partial [Rhizomicrobium sp.]
VFVSVRLNQQTQEQIDEFEKAVASWTEVTECYLMTGSRDYLLHVYVDGIEGYERFLKQKMTRLKCIQSVETNFAMSTIKKRIGLPPI